MDRAILLTHLPESVREVLSELASEFSTQSVWLVGSRANQSARSDSDWDMLVFSSVDTERRSPRRPGIDVIRVGPSGLSLLEGKSEVFRKSFDDWKWNTVDERLANYLGAKTDSKSVTEGVVYDLPKTRATKQQAFLLWTRN